MSIRFKCTSKLALMSIWLVSLIVISKGHCSLICREYFAYGRNEIFKNAKTNSIFQTDLFVCKRILCRNYLGMLGQKVLTQSLVKYKQ